MIPRRVLWILAIVGVICTSTPVIASATPQDGINIVTIGDSMVAGAASTLVQPGILPDGTPIVGNLIQDRSQIRDFDDCHISQMAFTGLLAQMPGVKSATNVGCGGTTIQDIRDRKDASGNTQYDALNEGTDVALTMQGGNTIGFAELVSCIAILHECTGDDDAVKNARLQLLSLRSELVQVLRDMRTRAPNALIVAIGYAAEFDTPGLLPGEPIDGCGKQVSESERAIANELQTGLNQAWREAVAAINQSGDHRITYLEPRGDFQHPPGYETVPMRFSACDLDVGHMMNGLISDRPDRDGFHLNRWGHWAFAQYVRQLLIHWGLLPA